MDDQIKPFGLEPIRLDRLNLYKLSDQDQAVKYVYHLLSKEIDRQTVMFVSHGESILNLLCLITKFETIEPYSVVLTEEILGEPFHLESYELCFRENGLIDILNKRGIPFYRILSRAPSLSGTIRIFTSRILDIVTRCHGCHAFLELKDDGSLGGIKPFVEPHAHLDDEKYGSLYSDLIVGYRDESESDHAGHISISLRSLHMMNKVWVFAFGEGKRPWLNELIGETNSRPENNPLLYLKDLPGQVHLFTDQEFAHF